MGFQDSSPSSQQGISDIALSKKLTIQYVFLAATFSGPTDVVVNLLFVTDEYSFPSLFVTLFYHPHWAFIDLSVGKVNASYFC